MQETQEMQIQSIGREDPLEKGMATQSSILAWKIPWAEEAGRLQSMGSLRVRHNWVISTICSLTVGNSNGKNLPTVWETWVWSLDREDPLEEGMETHSSIHAWRIPWTKEPGGLQAIWSQRVGYDWSNLACSRAKLCKGKNLRSKSQLILNCSLTDDYINNVVRMNYV